MKKLDLGQSLGILANVGVIAGIVFLGVEIGQNTRSLEASAYQDLTDRIIEINNSFISRPELRVARSTVVDSETFLMLPEEQREQLQAEALIRIRYGDLAFHQYELGMLDEQRFESAMAPLLGGLCSWLYLQRWDDLRENFVPGYRQYVDSRVRQC